MEGVKLMPLAMGNACRDQSDAKVKWLFAFQRGVTVASKSQFGLPA